MLQDALPAADPSLNIAVSIDGIPLLHLGTASATSSSGDFAIAVGNDANARATGGFGDFASAYGTDTTAFAGDGDFDLATANSVFSTAGGIASAGDGNFDVAQEGGLDGVATAHNGSFDSAFALTGNSGTAVAEFGNGFNTVVPQMDRLRSPEMGTRLRTEATLRPFGVQHVRLRLVTPAK